jgi:hypothetical protein
MPMQALRISKGKTLASFAAKRCDLGPSQILQLHRLWQVLLLLHRLDLQPQSTNVLDRKSYRVGIFFILVV